MKELSIQVKSSFWASHFHTGKLNEEEHKHNFIYTIILKGKLNEEGYVEDFRKIEQVLQEQNLKLENTTLNKILTYPTTENLAIYLLKEIKKSLPLAHKIVLQEKENYSVIYEE